jgi:hypothetical protein
MSINSQTLMRAAGNGIAVGIVQEGLGDEKGKQAVMSGAYMAGGSLLTDILGNNNPLANQANWGPNAKAFSDSVLYTAIEAVARKGDRTPHEVFRNFIIGFGSSFLTSIVMTPLGAAGRILNGAGAPAPGAAPAAPTAPMSRSYSTNSY